LVTSTATDASGNTSTCIFELTVNDTEAPIISCPDNITVSNDPGQCGAIISFTATATDNCGATVSYEPASGSFFTVGTTIVTATATNSAGNTSTCTFEIIVNDMETPIISCPDDITVSNDPGQCGAIVTFDATASDNCGVSIGYQPASGSFFSTGTTIVTVTATDSAGNTSTCIFEIIVNDTETPIISCPVDITVSNDPGQCGAIVTFDATASDNCGVSISYQPASGSFFSTGTTIVTATATDSAGNTSTCIFEIIVNDTEAPIFNCPEDITITVPFGSGGGNVNLSSAIATDNCSVTNVENDFNSNGDNASGFYPIGTTNVTYTASDAAGNTADCFLSVTVIEAAPDQLTISCPENVVLNTDTGICGANIFIPSVSTTGGAPPVTISNNYNNGGPDASGIYPVGITTVVMLATDNLGNTATCSFSVTVEDNQMPLISCPQDISILNDPGQCGAIVTFQATTTDNCGTSINYQPASGSFFSVGTTTVSATATDASGNSSTCSFEVTVNDTEAPIFNCPEDITITVPFGSGGGNVNLSSAIATDNCSVTNVENDFNSNGDNASGIYPIGTTNVTYTASDAAGNTADCFLSVTVIEAAPDQLTISCPENVVLNTDTGICGANIFIPSVSTTGGAPPVTISNNYNNGGPDASGIYPVGITTVVMLATDNLGNTATCSFSVTVEDNQLPLISCPQDISIPNDPGQCGAIVTFQATTTDNCSASINYQPASGSFFSVGTTTVSATATDASGNSSTCSFEVTVNDTEAPIISCPGDITISNDPGQCGAIVTFEATTTDNCSASINYQPASGSFFSVGTTTVSATATDASGNSSTCSLEVTVNDTEAPIISCPGDITISNDPGQCGAIVTFEATTTDNCSASISYQPTSGSFFEIGTTIVTSTATDASGNTGTCSFEITVNDTEAPNISCPGDITVSNDPGLCGAVLTFEATTTDNCGASISYQPASGSFFEIGTTIVTSTATDASGNTSTCSFEITVNDTEAPNISCPGDITISNDPGQCGAIVSFEATATDNCGASISYQPASGSFFPTGTNIVTAIATDTTGNTSTCTFEVTVNDTEAPQISCFGNITITVPFGSGGGNVNLISATATDNCSSANIENDFNSNGGNASGFYPIGTTNVTFIASDASGNTVDCLVSVTVIEAAPDQLTISCPENVVLNTDTGVCGADIVIPNASTTGGVPPVTISNNYNNGGPDASGIYPVGITTVVMLATDDSGNTTTCSFTVTVEDNQFPMISCPQDIIIPNDPGQCGAIVSFEAPATDNCGTNINYQPASGSFFSVGSTTVTATATDFSGNTSTCTFEVTVIDTEVPQISCPEDITISVPYGSGGGNVNLSSAVATDNCPGLMVVNDFSEFGSDASGFYPIGLSEVTFLAQDFSGNIVTCQVNVTVIEDTFSFEFTLSGTTLMENTTPVPGTKIVSSDSTFPTVYTDSDGYYSISNIPLGATFSMLAEKDTNHTQGISTFDIVLIQRHILQVELLNSPYEKIAADVNDNGIIEIGDIIQLRRIILQLDPLFLDPFSGLPNNTSWKFVLPGLVDLFPSSPFLPPYNTVLAFSNLNSNINNASWIAVKIGDVNNSSNPVNMNEFPVSYNRNPWIWEVEDAYIKAGERNEVSIKNKHHEMLDGFQVALKLPSFNIEDYFEVSATLPSWSGSNYNPKKNQVLMSWSNVNTEIQAGQELFTLEFTAQKSGMLSEFLQLDTRNMNAEAYSHNMEIMDIQIVYNTPSQPHDTKDLSLIPNPAKDEVVIDFHWTKTEWLSIEIWNLLGQLVHKQAFEGRPGSNNKKLALIDFAKGSYLVRIQGDETMLTGKLIITDH
jgi:large repetitive protein